MAIATLDKLYGNADVFTGVVKIRKGLSCKLILHTNSMDELHEVFYNFAASVKSKSRKARKKGIEDPNFDRTQRVCDKIIELTGPKAVARGRAQTAKWATLGGFVGAAALWTKRPASPLNRVNSTLDTVIQAGLVATGMALCWLGPWNAKSNLRPAREIDPKTA